MKICKMRIRFFWIQHSKLFKRKNFCKKIITNSEKQLYNSKNKKRKIRMVKILFKI